MLANDFNTNEAKKIRDQHEAFWEQELKTHALRYPDSAIVSYFAKNWCDKPANQGRRVLDIGFGSGNTFPLLNDYGFEVHGIELSEHAVAGGQAVLAALKATGVISRSALEQCHYDANSFDVLISWGSLFLSTLDIIKKNTARCFDLLKPGGGFLVNFRSPDNWFNGLGKEVGPFTYALDERAGPYAGITYTFLPEPEARACLIDAGFIIDNMERLDHWKLNATQQHSWHIYWARKPAEAEL